MNRSLLTTAKFAATFLVLGLSLEVAAIPVTYSVTSATNVYGADATHAGSTVSLQGYSGTLEIPLSTFSVTEVTVGLFSLATTNPLSRNLTVGFSQFPYAIDLRLGAISKTLSSTLFFNADHSNDSFYIQGGSGTTLYGLMPGLNIEVQFLTASVPGANAGETTTGELRAQFYGRPYTIPEPATFGLVALALAVMTLRSASKEHCVKSVLGHRELCRLT